MTALREAAEQALAVLDAICDDLSDGDSFGAEQIARNGGAAARTLLRAALAAAEREALRAEVEGLRRDLAENEALRERMADLLRRTAVALRGPEPALTRWSWHDLPERAAAAAAQAKKEQP